MAAMDEEQLRVVTEFVDELLSLGVLRPYEILSNAPMFIVPKEGQPGQCKSSRTCYVVVKTSVLEMIQYTCHDSRTLSKSSTKTAGQR